MRTRRTGTTRPQPHTQPQAWLWTHGVDPAPPVSSPGLQKSRQGVSSGTPRQRKQCLSTKIGMKDFQWNTPPTARGYRGSACRRLGPHVPRLARFWLLSEPCRGDSTLEAGSPQCQAPHPLHLARGHQQADNPRPLPGSSNSRIPMYHQL